MASCSPVGGEWGENGEKRDKKGTCVKLEPASKECYLCPNLRASIRTWNSADGKRGLGATSLLLAVLRLVCGDAASCCF